MGAGIVWGAGALGLEQHWLERIRSDQSALREDPRILRRPGLVIVPSRSLRQHLQARAAHECAGVLLGVRFLSLPQLPRQVLPREQTLGLGAFAALVARALPPDTDEATLQAVRSSVRDVLHAQWNHTQLEACLEALNAVTLRDRERANALLVLRVAGEVQRLAQESGICLPGEEFQRAAAAIRRSRPGIPLDARWIHIHGFADATGSATELLHALLELPVTTLFQDGLAGSLEPCGFGAGWLASLARGTAAADRRPVRDPLAEVSLLRGRCTGAELRAVAGAVEDALAQGTAQGTAPERIAIVARDLETIAPRLRRHLRALGIACSGLGVPGSPDGRERCARALRDVAMQGDALGLERWRMAQPRIFAEDTARRASLTVAACHLLGASTLAQLAQLDLDAHMEGMRGVTLPVPAVHDDETGARRKTTVARADIESLQQAVRRLIAQWQALCEREEPADLLAPACRDWLVEHFQLDPKALDELAEECVEDSPPQWRWRGPELLDWLLAQWVERCRTPLAGKGAGVSLLNVMEARGRTFDRLFVIGLQAMSFPSRVAEDLLLSDAARRALLPLLEALPLKSGIAAEDRYYFESLLRAAPRVTLAWSVGDDAGAELQPSPFVEAWLRAGQLEPPPPCELPQNWRGRADALPEERALAMALCEPARPHAEILAEVCEPQLARALAAVLHELEPAPNGRPAPGAFLGRVGRALPADQSISVSALENTSGCPWQAFLRRGLRLGQIEDPLAFVPDLSPQIVGIAVHRVLEKLARPGARATWPSEREVQREAEAAALHVIREEQLAPLGLRHWLVEKMQPYLEAAANHYRGCTREIVGSELKGELAIPGGARRVSFRADRVERDEQGELWIDFKTGKPLTSTKSDHAEKQLTALRSGTHLQAAVYAAARDARGRYHYLAPSAPEHARVFEYTPDPSTRANLEATLERLDAVWVEGGFVPRLAQADKEAEPLACHYCEVRLACLRGDSGAKLRIQAWLADPNPLPEDAPPDERAALTALRLKDGADTGSGSGEGGSA